MANICIEANSVDPDQTAPVSSPCGKLRLAPSKHKISSILSEPIRKQKSFWPYNNLQYALNQIERVMHCSIRCIWVSPRENPPSGLPTRSNPNQAARLQSLARKYKFRLQLAHLLSCQPRVTVTSCFVYIVIGTSNR